jgi:hypothetical protein
LAGVGKEKNMFVTLTPAYGRDYRTKKEVEADWYSGKDFLIANLGPQCGRYINKTQCDQNSISATIRYSQLRKAIVVHPVRAF